MINHRLHRFKRQIIPNEVTLRSVASGSRRDTKTSTTFGTQIVILATCFLLFATFLMGCDAFVRKFTRKPKRKDFTPQQIVLEPEEYQGPQMSQEEIYRQYFLYWKSWHDELIQALLASTNHKKQIDCANETIKNLEQMKSVLDEERKKGLDIYVSQLKNLRGLIKKDIYGNNVARNRLSAERIKRNILKKFSYHKIKDYLI